MFAAPHRLPRGDCTRRVGCYATLAERRDVAGLNAVLLAVAKILLGGAAPIRRGHHTVVVVKIDEISADDVKDNHFRPAVRHGFRRVSRRGGTMLPGPATQSCSLYFHLPFKVKTT